MRIIVSHGAKQVGRLLEGLLGICDNLVTFTFYATRIITRFPCLCEILTRVRTGNLGTQTSYFSSLSLNLLVASSIFIDEPIQFYKKKY